MNMQGTAYGQYLAASGTTYTASSSGVVSSVANGDVVSMLNMGCVPIDSTLGTRNVNLTVNGRNSDGSVLAAAAAAGKWGQTITLGTAYNLVSEAASSNSKTSTLLLPIILPDDYTAGNDVTVGVDCIQTGGAATVKTLDCLAYRVDGQGATGADICETAIQSMGTTRSVLSFVLAGETLSPGDLVMISLVGVLTEAAAGSVLQKINGVTIS